VNDTAEDAARPGEPPLDSHAIRARLLSRGGRFAAPLPDFLMAALLAMAALLDFIPPERLGTVTIALLQSRDALFFALMIEGGFLLMQGTLVDIASRLKKRPPVWLIVLILGGVVLFSGEARSVLRSAWEQGLVVFVPLLLSLAERGAILWHLPSRSTIQKIAARALISNRITTGLALFGLMTAVMMVGVIFSLYEFSSLGAWPPLAAGAVYFGVAAFDDWRVRGRRFAERPSVLFGFDPLGITHLDPL